MTIIVTRAFAQGIPGADGVDGVDGTPGTSIADGQSPSEVAGRTNGIMVHIGDSNTNGRPGYRSAYLAEWLSPRGLFEGWTSYNIGQNGSTLSNWANLEVTRLTDPIYRDLPPADYNLTEPGAGALARAINAQADLYLVSLGTNDLNSPSGRASIGTEANLRINLEKLINAILINTKGAILLRMPQPFENSDFSGITQWVDSAEVQEASRRLRQVYREWKGKNNRVDVYDSHAALFGNHCESRNTDCQDPYLTPDPANPTANNLISDGLHPNELGYERIVQQIGSQLHGMAAPRKLKPEIIGSYQLDSTAVWSVCLHARGTAASGATSATIDFDFNAESALVGQDVPGGKTQLISDSTFPTIKGVIKNFDLLELPTKLGNLHNLYRSLLSVPDKSRLFAYSHTTKVTTQITNITVAQIVTVVDRPYVQLTVTAANLTGFGGGRITFYTVDVDNIPFIQQKSLVYNVREISRHFSILGGRGKIFTLTDIQASRGAGIGTPSISLTLVNQGDNRFVTGTETFAAPGKPIGTITFSAYARTAAIIWDATNYPEKKISLAGDPGIIASVSTMADFVGSYYDLVFSAFE